MKYTTDDNGYITIPDNPISKSGVFPYSGRQISPELEPDKIYMVWRPEEELNNAETIQSFKQIPWIPRHEMLGDGYTDAEKVGVQGATGEGVYYKDGTLYSNLRLFGSSLKAAIRAGLKELSCGFKCAWDIVSGTTPDGVKYDVIQRQIRGNHLASVEEGRMGSDIAVAMDSATFALDNLDIDSKGGKMTIEEMMAKVKEAQPAKEELQKLASEIQVMLGGDSPEMDEDNPEEKDTDKPVEDMDKPASEDGDYSEDKGDAEDKDMAEDKLGKAMDAIDALTKKIEALEGNAMDAAQVEKQINEKNQLITDLAPVVGRIDGAGMDSAGVAKKAAKLIGIACDEGHEVSAVKAYLHARKEPKTTVDTGVAQDAAVETPESLKALGL